MNFSIKLFLRLLSWSLIFGFVSGIFGIGLSLIQVADFYLLEGTQQVSDTYTYKVLNSDNKLLTDEIITVLQNVEGVAFVDPYLAPTNDIVGSINYFGFSASYPVQIQGIPKRLGQKKAKNNYRASWNSADLSSIPVLLPQQAITLYNNLAPQRSWPTLAEESFLGLPGASLSINNNKVSAVISGFDADEFGTIITVPAQKIYAIIESLGLNPNYDYILIETVPGLTKSQARDSADKIKELGFELTSAKAESFQQGVFIRIKYTTIIFGFSILIAFIFLLHYNIRFLFEQIRQRVLLHRIWAVKDNLTLISGFFAFIFAIITGIISWLICFFAVVPAQKYIIDTITRFGLNAPSLRDSVRISLETGVLSTVLFLSITLLTIIHFFVTTPKANHIKKF